MEDDEKTVEDLDSPEAPSIEPVQSIETDEAAHKAQDENERGNDNADVEGSDDDAPGEVDDEMIDVADATADDKISNDLYKAFKAITEVLLNYKIKVKNNDEYFPAGLFKRLPNKRLLPDYYEVIKEPSAISTLRGKIQRKQYSGVPEFVRDFALVVHNAQLYNRPNSQPVRDILKLDELFKAELHKLVHEGYATEDEIRYPDLGEIPYASPEPDPVSEDDDGDEDGEEDEDEEEADDSDDDKRKRRGRRGTKSAGKKGDDEDEDDKAADAEQKRRGRPPKVATPMEHRIDRILKSLRKTKSQNGIAMIGPFERLPDKAELPEYYQVIPNPIAYDILRKKAKRKKYSSIEEFMKDVQLMFTNAMTFNEDGSDIHKWAQELLEEARRAEAEESAKPDTEYMQAAEGRIPLEHITYKDDTWKIGDWIHVQNPNDITKPIVAQIYRTWKTANDEEWINACWYYRPEQTVHQYEKHFYPNEVVKTGQYRDHKIEEVLNKCFVMFYTRYSRGRPRNLPADTEVYVCEARYNEDKFKFNKIKTWASCLPDEVRDKDYEMDLFDTPRKIKKVPSPLLNRLKDEAKSTDQAPQPEWKHANAPPLVGGIHKRPRDENQSPPPEATPPPQPAPTPVARTPSVNHTDSLRVNAYPQANSAANTQAQHVRPAPSMTPQASFNNNTGNQYARQPSHSSAAPYSGQAQSLPQHQAQPYQYTPQPNQPTPVAAAHPGSYNHSAPTVNYNRTAPVAAQATQYNAQQAGETSLKRIAEAYILSDTAYTSIPKEVRDQFPQDEEGRVLFFTSPPLNTRHIVSGSTEAEQGRPLEHSDRYTKAIALRKRKAQQQVADANGDVDTHDEVAKTKKNTKRLHTDGDGVKPDQHEPLPGTLALGGRELMSDQIKQTTYNEYQSRFDQDWRKYLLADLEHGTQRRQRETQADAVAEEKRKVFTKAHLGQVSGQYGLNEQGYISGWQKNFFTGTYLDDYDSRLP